MTADQIAQLAGIMLALGLAYIPGVREWYDPLPSARKVAVLGALLIAAALVIAAQTCGVEPTCYQNNYQAFIAALIQALIASQAAYLVAVRPFQSPPPATFEPQPAPAGTGTGAVL